MRANDELREDKDENRRPEQLDVIADKADRLREGAAPSMKSANAAIDQTETPIPTPDTGHRWATVAADRIDQLVCDLLMVAVQAVARLGVLPGTGSNASMERTPDGKCGRPRTAEKTLAFHSKESMCVSAGGRRRDLQTSAPASTPIRGSCQ